MKNSLRLLAALAIVAPLTLAEAQFVTGPTGGGSRGGGSRGGGDQAVWDQFKLDSKKKLQLSFRNASVDAIVDLLSRTTGVTILKDPALTQPMTLTSAKAVGLKEALQIFNAALGLRGFELAKEGTLMVIRKKEQRQQGGFDPSMMAQMMQGAQQSNSELKVYRIKYAAASEVARVVNEVFIQQQQMQFPGMPMMMQMGGGRGGPGGNRFGGNRGGFSFGGFGGFGGQQQPNVRASSDDFSNSIIVNAPKDKQIEVEALIEEIDKQTDQPLTTKTYKLTYAVATDMIQTVQGVLQSNAPRGRGGPSSASVNQRFSFVDLFNGNSRNGQGSVTADDRSNTLVVSTTTDNQTIVANLIKELDQEVPIVNTTFVFPLQNARADAVSQILQSAFGTRNGSGNNRGGTNRTGATGANTRNTNNRNNAGGNNNNALGGRAVDDTRSQIDVPIDPEKADEGVLMTDVWVQQGQMRFGMGGQNSRQQSSLVRGADGQVVNQRDLTNQVTIIPDTNTNSLVVVTTPDNVRLLQEIIGQLDAIPEQVMIETMIVEATLDKSSKLGVEWTLAQPKAFGQEGVTGDARSNFGLQSTSSALEGFKYTVTGGNISTFINALKTDDRFEVLSTPRIFTSNNVEAEINISQSVPYVLSTREDTNGNLTYNYAFQDVGIVLNVTPRITSNGYVTMEISQTANDLQGFTDFNAPIVNQRQADTTVSVKDGETIVLGGIMRSTVNTKVKKLPLLGDIPILGELFKSTTKTNNKTELLVFLKPSVVRDPDEARAIREKQQNDLSPAMRDKVQKNIMNSQGSPASSKTDKGNKVGQPSPQTGGAKPGEKQKP